MQGELRRRAAAAGVESSCRFEPASAQVAEWLRAIDIFVLPSRSEALSNSLMEAMACGCAPVASRVGGNPELIAHGETGLLFEPGDAEELARHLELLAGNRDLRVRLGAAAAVRIRREFSVEQAARRMEQIYASLQSSAARPAKPEA